MSKRACRSGKTSSSKEHDTEIKRSRDNNWRDTRTSAQCLSYLYLSEHLSDVTFSFSADKRVKLSAHKFVLSMRSAVFEAMFYGSLSERGETVLIEDIEPEVMKVVLQYIYSDKPNIDGNNVLPCLYTANKYQLVGLVQQCSDYIERNIDESNVCPLHEQAVLYDMKRLREKCLQYVIENATNVLFSATFLQLSHATLLNILKKEELAAGEIEIFKAAVKWAEHQCEANKLSKNGQNVRNQLREALFQIRFPIMPIEELARVVTPTEILTKDELLMLYQYNATKGSTPLGKFKKQERLGAPKIIDFKQYSYTTDQQYMGRYGTCRLGIGRDSSQQQLEKKSIKLKSFAGTFVKKIKGININGTAQTTNYHANGKEIIFMNPVDVSGNLVFDFLLDNSITANYRGTPGFSNHISFKTKQTENIKGQITNINCIPDGLETITFV